MTWLERLPPPVRRCVEPLLLGPAVQVVFDADGTLWRGDVGEDLLRFLSANGALGHRSRGAYGEYERRLGRTPRDAYAFAVEVMAGLDETELAATCQRFFDERYAGRVHWFVRPMFEALHRAGHELWVVSASPKWVVEPGVRAVGGRSERVLAVSCAIDDGRLSGRVDEPLPAGVGKVEALERHGVVPALAWGDGAIDVELLASATKAVVVKPRGRLTVLAAEAGRRGWPILEV